MKWKIYCSQALLEVGGMPQGATQGDQGSVQAKRPRAWLDWSLLGAFCGVLWSKARVFNANQNKQGIF